MLGTGYNLIINLNWIFGLIAIGIFLYAWRREWETKYRGLIFVSLRYHLIFSLAIFIVSLALSFLGMIFIIAAFFYLSIVWLVIIAFDLLAAFILDRLKLSDSGAIRVGLLLVLYTIPITIFWLMSDIEEISLFSSKLLLNVIFSLPVPIVLAFQQGILGHYGWNSRGTNQINWKPISEY